MYTSMRTRTIVALVVVGAMVPAGTAFAGSDGSSINALVGSQQSTGQEGSGAQSSVNALVGADSEQSPSQPANTSTLNALVGADSEQSPSQPANTSTLNALVGADSEQSPSQPANTSTLNALVGAEPQTSPRQSSPAGADYATVGAIVGDQTPSPSPTAVASSPDDGFDWTDALFGGLAAFGLTALMIVAARSVIRHRRPVAASGA
jgi:hypothetical protein